MTKADKANSEENSFDKEEIMSLTKEIDEAASDHSERKVKRQSLRRSDSLYKLTQQQIEDLILQEHTPVPDQRKLHAENWNDHSGIQTSSKYYDSVDVKLLESIEQSYLGNEYNLTVHKAGRPSSASSSSSDSSSSDSESEDDPKTRLPPPYSTINDSSSA